MYDHNGTYMESVSLRYQEASIQISIDDFKAPQLVGTSCELKLTPQGLLRSGSNLE
jgi:hypothetical protein